MSTKSILATGDVVVDHHIYEGRRRDYTNTAEHGVRVQRQPGGAALVSDLLREVLALNAGPGTDGWSVHLGAPDSGTSAAAYAFWRPFPRNEPREKQCWRVSEAMGFGGDDGERAIVGWSPAVDLPKHPEVVVIADAGMGFRGAERAWPVGQLASAEWIVLKTTAPMDEGPLWDHLTASHQDRSQIDSKHGRRSLWPSASSSRRSVRRIRLASSSCP